MILAADFGGTTIKPGVVRDGSITARPQLEANADRPMSDRLEAVASAWETLLKKAGGGQLRTVKARLWHFRSWSIPAVLEYSAVSANFLALTPSIMRLERARAGTTRCPGERLAGGAARRVACRRRSQ